MIGWKKLPIRSQDTLDRWLFNLVGDIVGLVQRPFSQPKAREIPNEKLLLFRTTSRKNSPQGVSMLRNAYRPWFFKKRIEEIEGIGIERDLAGLPVAHVPAEILSSDAGTEETALRTELKKIIRNIRRDEQEGVLFPLVYDENGKEIFKILFGVN